MKAFVRRLVTAASAGAILIAASAAGAQGAPPPQQGMQGQPDLHSVLHIRPDQEAAFHVYQQGIIPPAGLVASIRSAPQRAMTMTTPQRLDLQMDVRQLAGTIFQHQADAVRKFYAALSPEQRRTYDQVTLPPMSSRGPQR